MGRAKEQPTKRKTTLPLWPPAGGPQRKTMGGEDWPSLAADSLKHPEGSSSQRDLTLVSKRTEISWIQKRDKVFWQETSIRALTRFDMGQMQKKWLESTEMFPWATAGIRWGRVSQYLFLFATPIYWQSLETGQVCFLCSSFISILWKINTLALATSVSALSFPATRIAWQNEVSANYSLWNSCVDTGFPALCKPFHTISSGGDSKRSWVLDRSFCSRYPCVVLSQDVPSPIH